MQSRRPIAACLILFMGFGVAAAAAGAQPAGQMIGQIGGPTQAVATQGNFAYVGAGPRLLVLDISAPTGPRELGATAPFSHFVEGVAVSGTLVYVAAGDAGLRVVDVSNPARPTEIGAWDSPGYAQGVAVAGSTVYLADGSYGLSLVDVSSPAQPRQVGSVYDTNYAFAVAVTGHYAYIAAAGAGLLIADVSAPSHPVKVGTLDTPGYAYGLAVSGHTVYMADGWEGLQVVNATDPAHPAQVGSFKTRGWSSSVALSGSLAFVADSFGGLRILQVSDPAHPTELAGFEVQKGDAAAVAMVGTTAYVADRNWGLLAVSVADPASPTQVGIYGSLPHGDAVTVAGGYAYVAAGFSGLSVIDVNDPAQPRQVGVYDTGGTFATGVAVDGTRAYVVAILGPQYGLHVLDVSDPSHPKRLALYQVMAEQFHDVSVVGNSVYLAGEHYLYVVDVSDPARPAARGFVQMTTEFGSFDVRMAISGGRAYVALHGLKIVDISNPSAPAMIGDYTPPSGVEVADVAVIGQQAYLAGGQAGLRIVDVSDASHVTELGSFQTSSRAIGISVSGTVAYVADGTGLQVIDVSNSVAPTRIASYATPGYAHAIALAGDLIYVADEGGGLSILTRNAGLDTTQRTTFVQQRAKDSTVKSQSDVSLATHLAPVVPPIVKTIRRDSAATCVVTNALDAGPGTLRRCLEDVQAGDTITFDSAAFSPSHPATITLQTPLPALTKGQQTIDGSNAGVILDGHNTSSGISGLVTNSDGNVIRGLQLVFFPESGISIWGKGNTAGGDRRQGSGPMGQGNLASGNGQNGVKIDGSDSTDNTVIGNYIGTTANGRAVLANGSDGVFIAGGAFGNVIRDNVISGNPCGVAVTDWGSSYNVIVGNLIGTDATGTATLGNGNTGVTTGSGAGRNRIGGTSPEDRNVISISGGSIGIYVGAGVGTLILGNFIGTDIRGAAVIGNTDNAIGVGDRARLTFVGGSTTGERNLISGNNVGVLVGTDSNIITNNLIGTDASGQAALGNVRSGIDIYLGAHNIIQADVIAYTSGGPGVKIQSPLNTLRQTQMHDNQGGGIVLSNGGNAGVSPPVITGVTVIGVSGTACAGCEVEIFSDAADEGRDYEGTATADASGTFTFNKGSSFAGPKVTATATDRDGNTSQFSGPTAVLLTALTNAPSNITTTAATLNGSANPSGAETTAWFEWGLDTSYGNTTPSESLGGGTNTISVSVTLTGLSPGTTYHYRIVARSSAGTTNGVDVSFVTTPIQVTPTITWANPAAIVYGTSLGATQLNATANVAGTFVYTPSAGTIVRTGQTLSVTFTPTDTASYTTATRRVTIDVVLGGAPFTDASLFAGVTSIRVVHVTELRTRISALRAQRGLGAYAWTDATLVAGQTPLRAVHITELRAALQQVYVAAGQTPPVYTDPVLTSGQTMMKAVHIMELRAAVVALE